MVTTDPIDFVTLHYTDPTTGQRLSVDPVGNPGLFAKISAVESAQKNDIPQANQQAIDAYNSAVKLYNTDADAGRPVPLAPVKPQMILMDDLGNKTTTDFQAGTLLDLHTPAPPAVIQPGFGPGESPTGNTDALNGLLAMVKGQSTLLAKIAAKLGVS